MSMSCAFSVWCVSHSSPSSTASMRSQKPGSPAALRPVGAEMPVVDLAHLRREPRLDVHAVGDVADRHVLRAPVRERAASTSRARPGRAATTRRWRGGTVFSASTVMQNSSSASPGSTRPSPISSSWSSPSASRSGPRCSSIRGERKPVVAGRHRRVRREDDLRGDAAHRLPRVDALRRPSAAARARAPANALCPSLRCRTPGEMPSAASARTPPTPSSSSWRMRTRSSPP